MLDLARSEALFIVHRHNTRRVPAKSYEHIHYVERSTMLIRMYMSEL